MTENKENLNEIIKKVYYDPNTGFQSPYKIYKRLKQTIPDIKVKDIKDKVISDFINSIISEDNNVIMLNLNNDSYQKYTLDANNKPVDSTTVDVGWLRRPTDRMITFGMFFQDYLSTNKNFKLYLNTLYGSNLPYNIPNSTRYRNALVIDPYIRVDLGLSCLLLDAEKNNKRSHSPFKNFESIWASLEIFNLIDRPNTISYLLVKDFQNNLFTMPNRLTPRLVNLKLVAKW